MIFRRHNFFIKGVLVISILAIGGVSVWAFQNRDAIVAACLNTVDGVTSKLAHLSQPFGIGSTVEPKNPVLGIVPDFTLTERSGRQVGKSDLLGGYWVASFIFTRCVTSCPKAATALAELQTQLPDDVTLVSFSVDPEYDSPDVLTEYAEKVGANVDRWLFLTGETVSMHKYIREGFHLAVQPNSDADPGWEVTHSPRFALVDPKGRIRGYYESSDPEELLRLREDVGRLTQRPGAAKSS